jgi:hypothetical protein
MDSCTRDPAQDDVADHLELLGGAAHPPQSQTGRRFPLVHASAGGQEKVLAMVHHREVEDPGVFHRPPHDLTVLHRSAVVGDGDDPRRPHLSDFRQLFAPGTHGDGARGKDVHQARIGGSLQNEPGDGGVVVDGSRIGHADDAGEASCRCRAGAREHGLLVFPARLAKVHVHVDEARCDHTACDVDDLAALAGGQLPHSNHFPVFEEDVRLPIQILGRVYDPASAQQQTHDSSSPAPNRR